MRQTLKDTAQIIIGILLLLISLPLVMLGAALMAGENYVKNVINEFKEEFKKC